jgi:iron complex outermembrane receptor protein
LKTGDNQRGNLDLSISPKFFDDHLSINANVKGIYQQTNWANGGAVGSALAFDPTKPVKDSNGEYWNWYTNGAPNSMASTNPLSQLYEYKNFGRTLRSIGNLQLDYKIHGFEDLRANLNLGYDVAKTRGWKYNELNSFLSKLSSLDLADNYTNFNMNTLLEFYLDYNHDFGWSNLDVMAGYSWQHNYVKYDDVQYYNNSARFTDSSLYYTAPTNAKEYYLVSFFGRVNWSIKSKYLFTFTVREDASSRFSKANRWGFFPSAAFAWNVANEDFLKDTSVSQLKFRLGWGRTGQQDIGSDYYPYLARYIESDALTMRYNMGDGNYTTLGPQAYNPNLKWETTETYNIGLDFGFANDRVTGTVEGYYRYTYDLLNLVSTPLGSNFSNVVMSNIGNMVNKGVEVALNVIPVETNNWHWSIGGNVTFQDTKITKLTEQNIQGYLGVTTGDGMGGTGGYTSLHRVGYSPYTFYLFQQLYDSKGAAIENGLVDRDGDGQITDSDRYVTGCSPTPWMYFGVNTRLSWKNWDFSINGHGSIGNYVINKVAMGYATSYSDDYNKGYINNLSNQYLVNGWTAAMINNQKYSDMFIENASFFKIDDINLGYTFRLNKSFIKDIRVAGSVQNVCTFTKYRGLDPEISSETGVDNNIIPRPRLYTLRMSINF